MFTPLTIKGSVAIVHLSGGAHATVSVEDWPLAMTRRWSPISGGGNTLYATSKRKGQSRVFMHRLIVPGVPEVDHRDNNGLNNCRDNLRPATRNQNAANWVRPRKNPGYRGVYHDKSIKARPYKVQVNVPGKNQKYYCGSYATAEEAARAYDAKAREVQGEFAVLNFPQPKEV